MQVIKKKLTVVALSLLAIVMAVLGFVSYNTAKADFTVDQVALTMDGASVRLVDYNGLRFTATMSSDDYDALVGADYDSVEFGMFIMPEAYTKLGELNQANTFDGGKFVWDVQTPTVGEGEDMKYRILHTVITPEEKGSNVELKASVVDFKPQNIATEYTACAYIKAVKGSDVAYNFATGDLAVSMLEVAYDALPLYEGEGDADAVEVLEGYESAYVDWYTNENGVAPQGSYTVKYVAGSEVISTADAVATDKLIEDVSVEVKAPRGYILADGQADVVTGKVYVNDIELIVNIVEKPVIDITEQSIGGTIGILAGICDLTHQTLELPVDIGGLQTASDSVVIHLNDTGWNAPVWASYDVEKQAITGIPTSAVKGFMANLTSGKTIKDVTIEGKNAYYKAKVELLGWKHSLRVLETAEDFANKFNTLVFQNATDSSVWSSYSYVLYNDIILDGSSENISYSANTNNNYGGIIDGRGHKLENIKIGTSSIWWGIINYKFSGVIKNIALTNVYNGGSNGMIASFVDGGTIENVYISGVSNRESLSSNITSAGITVKNVVYNFEDGWGSAGSTQHGYDSEVGGEYISETNVYTAFGNDNFFTEIAGKTFGNFTSEGNTLYFCGRAIYSK